MFWKKLKIFWKKLKIFYWRKRRAIVIDTNIPRRYSGDLNEGGFLKYLNGTVFIPWPVLYELKKHRDQVVFEEETRERINREGTPEEQKELEERALRLSAEEWEKREHRRTAHKIAYQFTQQKAERGKWKFIGNDEDIEPYLKAINEKAVKRIKMMDSKILATCIFIADNFGFKEVILLTNDYDLRTIAQKYGVKVEAGLVSLQA